MRKGFVLIATLWTVVIVFLLVESIDQSVGDELNRMIRVRDRLDDRTDLVATESLLKFYIASHRVTSGGFVFRDENPMDYTTFEGLINRRAVGGEIRVDGTAYRGLGDVRFALRDELGLVPINSRTNAALYILLRTMGQPDEQAIGLLAALVDYRDNDDYPLLRGGEHRAYEAAQMLPPRNDFLRSPRELRRVLGWWNVGLDENLLSDRRDSRMNFNASPDALLPAFFGANAQAVRELRVAEPFYSIDRVRELAVEPERWSEQNISFLAGSKLLLDLGVGNQCLTIALELTPFSPGGPIRERYRYETSCDVAARFPINDATPSLGVIARVGADARDARGRDDA